MLVVLGFVFAYEQLYEEGWFHLEIRHEFIGRKGTIFLLETKTIFVNGSLFGDDKPVVNVKIR